MIPPCEATGPDGSRVVIHPHDPGDSVAELARALDLPASTPLAIDGRRVSPHQRLIGSGLRVGSSVTIEPVMIEPVTAGESEGSATGGPIEVAVDSGPACGRWLALSEGRHSVGRAATADIRIDDPSVELHHAVIDVDNRGVATLTQLTGRQPVIVGDTPCQAGRRIGHGQSVRLGASRLLVRQVDVADPTGAASLHRANGSIVADENDPWRSVVRRGPTSPGDDERPALHVPEPSPEHRAPPLSSLVGAGVAAGGAGLLAALVGQALFALFAAVGAVASLATWVIGAALARRDRRRCGVTYAAARADFRQQLREAQARNEREHRVRHRTVVDALDLVHRRDGIWARRRGPGDALWATIGRGTCRWSPQIDDEARGRLDPDLLVALDACERLLEVPVPIVLAPSSVVAFHGSGAMGAALVRSLIVQLAANYGPADWELLVVTDDPDRWRWVSWLPQARRGRPVIAAGDAAALAAAMERCDDGDDGPRRSLVIVLDEPSLLTVRTGPIRRRLERGDAACITIVPTSSSVPAVADRILEVGDTGAARWSPPDDAVDWTSSDQEIHLAGLSSATAEHAARCLAPLIDPEDHDGAGRIPIALSLADLEPLDSPTTIARRWLRAGRDPAPVARLGRSCDGVVDVDLVRDGPHGLIAGTTGSGKSELLRTLVVSLAAQLSPEHLTMILVDYKGGSTFDVCGRLPHTVGVVTDLDDGLAERVLVSLDAEVRRRERLLRAAGVDALAGYRRGAAEPLARLVVVIDEFASLAKDLPDFLSALVDVAQRGRSLGIHLLLATQRPAGVVTDDIRANTNLRIALRLQDRGDAADVVGSDDPATFPTGVPGRAVLRLGRDELVVFQTASCSQSLPSTSARLRVERPVEETDGAPTSASSASSSASSEPTVLATLVDAIREAASMVAVAAPHRPWIDALPAVVSPRDLPSGSVAVGLVDDPENQCRHPLGWHPVDGNLLLVGAVGAGTTTAALALMAALARHADPVDLHIYVIDGHGEPMWNPLAAVGHCGGVIRLVETERLVRLLSRLAGEMERRSADGTRRPAIAVVIDGYGALRDALADVEFAESALRLDRLLRDGPALGISACVTTDGSSSSAIVVPRSATWVFRVGDPAVARAAGLRAGPIVTPNPGRLRVVETGLEAHVVFEPEPFAELAGCRADPAGGPPVVRELPAVVDPDELDGGDRSPGGIGRGLVADQPIELLVGLAADDLEPVVLLVPRGDHVFIGGGARSGRSTCLRQIEAGWRRVHPDGVVLRVDRYHPVGDDVDDCVGADAPVLVVVDDAERVDDPHGRLAAMVACGRPGLVVAVAARLDAVRVAYGHWTRDVARSRCGLLMTSAGDVDGELLGTTLPRRPMIASRPGLAWMVDQRGHRLVQVAARMQT